MHSDGTTPPGETAAESSRRSNGGWTRLRRSLLAGALVLGLLAAPAAGREPARLTVADLIRTLQSVLAEHPEPLQGVYLLRSSLRGTVAYLEAAGIEATALFGLQLPGDLEAAGAALEGALEELGLTPEQRTGALRAGLKSCLESLEDPGTRFYKPGEYVERLEDLGYSLGGVGFYVDEQPDARGHYPIVELIEGFPAERMGIRRGDRLVAAEGIPTSRLTFRELANLVRGPVGTRVTITIQRGDEPPRDYRITREWLNPNPKGLEGRMVGRDTAYVKIKYLGRRLHNDLRSLLEELRRRGARKLILDLRNCPGSVAGATPVADLFLPAGLEVVKSVSRSGVESLRTAGPAYFEGPLAVLINRYSAASPTVVAGALRDHRRATLIGEPTDPEEMDAYEWVAEMLPDGSTVTHTVSYYRLPLGKSLWKEGIRPDLAVPLDDPVEDATGKPGDAQFERALELLDKAGARSSSHRLEPGETAGGPALQATPG